MPGTRPNPTASRRALAARLRRMRLAAGKSTEEAARELMVSPSKISRLESGERAPQARDVRDLARFYGASDHETASMQELVIETRRRGWWADYRTEGEQGELYLGLETAASAVDVFEVLRWPGLLQTPEMTAAMLPRMRPPGEFDEHFVNDQVVVRRNRQQRLLSGDLQLHAILDEAMFHRNMGEGVIGGQVSRILELVQTLPNVEVQVVPFFQGPYPGLDGSFNLLRYPQGTQDLVDLVFVEGLQENTFLEHPSLVERYRTVFRLIASRYALEPEASVVWLKRYAASL